MIADIWVQAPGLVAAGLVVASFQAPTLRRMIGLQIAGYLFLGVHFSLLAAWTGAAMTGIGIVRLLVALGAIRNARFRRLYPVFFPVIWLACLVTMTGWESVLPAIGYTLGTLAVIQTNMMRTRILFLAAHPFWLAYNAFVGSYGGITMEVFNIASSVTAIARERRGSRSSKAPSRPAMER